MRRRDLVSLLGGIAVATPLPSRAQQSAAPVVGYVGLASDGLAKRQVDGLQQGLARFGYVAGQSVTIEYRWAEGRYERVPELVADLVRRRVDVICTLNNAGALAAKAATSQIPIVFVVGLDPVAMGLVASLHRPGGNATGVSFLASELEPKRLELLRDLMPGTSLVAAFINPDNPNAGNHAADLPAAAGTLGLQMLMLPARNVAEIEAGFGIVRQQKASAVLVTIDPIFLVQRGRFVELAARHAIPAIYPLREFADEGGLMYYGNDLADAARQVGIYAGRILRGAKPADLPVSRPTSFELIVNLRTARALGLTLPSAILARADEVIE
jgi:putative ABC transport system substrate-binding protein